MHVGQIIQIGRNRDRRPCRPDPFPMTGRLAGSQPLFKTVRPDPLPYKWFDQPFSPWIGCSKISPACLHCFAEGRATKYGLAVWGLSAQRQFGEEEVWQLPPKWNQQAAREGRRWRIFAGVLCDLCEDRPELQAPRERLKELITCTPNLDWLLVTKRPAGLLTFFKPDWWIRCPHAWAIVTTENQAQLDR